MINIRVFNYNAYINNPVVPGAITLLECDFIKISPSLLVPVQYNKQAKIMRDIYFSFFRNELTKYCELTGSDNVAEGGFLVAEDVLLVAMGHHQAVAKAVREATPCSLGRIPPQVDRSL